MSKNSVAVLKYRETHRLKRLDIPLTPMEYDELKKAAANAGESMTTYAKKSISDRIKISSYII